MLSYTLRTVTIGGALLGALSGIIGCFAVLRRQSLMGDTLSHAALPGVGIAFLIAGKKIEYLLLGAGIASLLGVGFISLITKMTRLKEESAMGIVLSGWFALGIGILVFIQQYDNAGQAGLDSFIFGQAAGIVQRDIRLLAGVSIVMFILLIANWKEFKLITFDPEFARSNGFAINAFIVLLMIMIVTTIVMGLQLAGVVLIAGLLIAPGVAARQWTRKLENMVLLSGVIGAISGATGSILSALNTNLPTGPMIIVVASSFAFISLSFAPQRGILWFRLRKHHNRIRFAANNVRKAVWFYALSHARDPEAPTKKEQKKAVSKDFLLGLFGKVANHGIRQLVKHEELVKNSHGYFLTSKGIAVIQEEKSLGESDI